jgi:hypothetical protein
MAIAACACAERTPNSGPYIEIVSADILVLATGYKFKLPDAIAPCETAFLSIETSVWFLPTTIPQPGTAHARSGYSLSMRAGTAMALPTRSSA